MGGAGPVGEAAVLGWDLGNRGQGGMCLYAECVAKWWNSMRWFGPRLNAPLLLLLTLKNGVILFFCWFFILCSCYISAACVLTNFF